MDFLGDILSGPKTGDASAQEPEITARTPRDESYRESSFHLLDVETGPARPVLKKLRGWRTRKVEELS